MRMDPTKDEERDTTQSDPWLEHRIAWLADRSRGRPVLELGCGEGRDTAILAAAGIAVVAVDNSAESLAVARSRVRGVGFVRADLRDPLPFADAGFGVVVASLSLHYFSWADTVVIFDRIRRLLWQGGMLLCRLNSTNDVNYGAAGHPAIEADYYSVNGQPKRFFDRPAIAGVFREHWIVRQCDEQIVHRYHKPKAVWEVLAERRH